MAWYSIMYVITAAFSSLRSQIVVELMGLDKLTTAFGQLIVLHGVAVIIGTPIAGQFIHASNKACQQHV